MKSCISLILFLIAFPTLPEDFSNLQEVIKKDLLNEKSKKNRVMKKGPSREEILKRRFEIPSQEDMWPIFTELWLVKNAQKLKWDFQKPDYGLDLAFKKMLESMGYFNESFKILLLNTPLVSHMAIPSGEREHILLLSVPFIRSMDLSKLEISVLLLEDFIRSKEKLFQKKVSTALKAFPFEKNFYKKSFPQKELDAVLNSYSQVVFEQGFDFQEQFSITIKMSNILKSNQKLWSTYFIYLQKTDQLVKENKLFEKHVQMYPSPEIQLNWLKGEK